MRRGALALALALALPAQAQVTADGTLGTAVSLGGSTYAITAGSKVGGNLFHSFGAFNLSTGQTAEFSSSQTGIANVVSRVTGGAASSIDGTVRSTISGANLFLVNPSGIAFGPNARLDVGGSFHASTASYLKLGASGRFDAANPGASVLTVDAPSAFGFLGSAGGLSLNRGILQVPVGKTLSLIGGDITATGTASMPARIEAPGGRVNLASVSGSGEATLSGSAIDASGASGFGDIALSSAIVRTENGAGAPGPIAIRGGSLTLANTFLSTLHASPGAGAPVDIALSGALSMTGGVIRVSSLGSGDAGELSIRAASVSLDGGAVIDNSSINFSSSGAAGTGRAGQTTIEAVEDVVLAGGSTLTGITFLGSGPAGDTRITARGLTVRDGASIKVSTFGDGAAGRVRISVQDLTLSGGGHIDANTEFDTRVSLEQGPGGSILVDASGKVDISGAGSGLFSKTSSEGAGGAIVVNAGEIVLRDGGRISGANQDPFGLGSIGGAGSIQLAARRVEISGAGTGVFSSTVSGGAGGPIAIAAGDIFVSDGGLISAESSGSGAGNAGSISLAAGGRIVLTGGGAITTESEGAGGGRIVIRAGELLALNASRITTSVRFGGGNGGDILIDPIFVTLDSSDIIARAIDGNGGNIFIVTQYLLQSLDSHIDATSQRGISGAVTISAPDSDVGSRLVALPSAYVDAASRLRESCAARAERPGNSFVGLGRGGLPASPEAAAFAGYGFAPSRAAELTIRAASCPGPRTG